MGARFQCLAHKHFDMRRLKGLKDNPLYLLSRCQMSCKIPEAQDTIFKLLILFNQQSKSHRWSFTMKQKKASYCHISEEGNVWAFFHYKTMVLVHFMLVDQLTKHSSVNDMTTARKATYIKWCSVTVMNHFPLSWITSASPQSCKTKTLMTVFIR